MKNNICVQKKKVLIVGSIVSIIIAVILSFFLGKLGEVVLKYEEFQNLTALDITLWLVPIFFIASLLSVLAIIIICDDADKKSK